MAWRSLSAATCYAFEVRFLSETVIAADAATVFAFHERPDAFELLLPPWQTSRIIQPPTSLRVGTRVILRTKIGPLWQTIEAEHVEYDPGRMFADRMTKGPFKSWLHRHIVTPLGDHESRLTDDITYELPLGVLGRVFGGGFARRELERLFEYRHRVTKQACERCP